MKAIVSFGEALIDFLAAPAPGDGTPRAFLQHAGGAPANVAVAVAELGGRAEFAGMLANDLFGDFLLESLVAAGVGTRHVRRTDAAPTALAFVSLAHDGERSFSFHRPPAADLLFRETHFDDAMFRDAAVFHVCSNSMTEDEVAATTLAGMRRARDAGALVSFDMNLRPALWPAGVDPAPRLWAALAAADVVKLSAEELAFIADRAGGEAAALDRIWQGHARLVVVTDGAAPLRWRTPSRSGSLDAFRVRAIDTTAAGDAFTAGLLLKLALAGITAEALPDFIADERTFVDVLRFASACGALAVTRPGAFSAMPGCDEVEALIGEKGKR